MSGPAECAQTATRRVHRSLRAATWLGILLAVATFWFIAGGFILGRLLR